MNKYLNIFLVIFWVAGIAITAGCGGGDVGRPGLSNSGAPAADEKGVVPATAISKMVIKKFGAEGGPAVADVPSAHVLESTEKSNDDIPQTYPESGARPDTVKPVDKHGRPPVVNRGRSGGRSGNPEPSAGMAPVADTDQKIILNFDDADLYEVIKMMAELLDISYIVDPGVKGRVTIQTAGGFSRKDLFSVFFQVLQANNLTAVREGNLYKIVPMKDASHMPIPSRTGADSRDLPMSERVLIQIIPLKFISSQEVTKLLTPFVSQGGAIVSDRGSNTLVVVDKWENILKILRLVTAFDVNVFDRVHYRFYRIKCLEAEEVVKLLSEYSAVSGEPAGSVKFIAISRLNSLLVVSVNPGAFDKIDDILRQIDVVTDETEPRIYVYFVKNGEAEDLGQLLEEVFLKKQSEKSKTQKVQKAGGASVIPGNPFSRSRLKAEKAEAKAKEEVREKPSGTVMKGGDKGESEGTGILGSEINITPDVIRNALIIEAIPSDHRIIDDILRRIDVLPRQVLIEATIAEVTHTSSMDLGMEWGFGKGAAEGMASFIATVGSTGLKYSIGVTDKWYAELNALAKKGLVNIISSPHVLASDNKEARIDVSREVPVASGSTTVSSGTAISETSIEYRDTGVILSVTPHINERGLVTMDIDEEVSDLDEEVNVADKNYPSFFKRTVKTTLTVKHGQTIVIGGLIRDKEEKDISGVPCLIDVPVMRYMFGLEKKSTEKIELIVLITPRVVANLDDVDAVTNEFKQKVQNVMRRFYPR